jgi:hypothetical protein
MLPREHGAYGQLAFPLVTSLVVAGPASPSLLTAAAVVALFLAHEPMLVLLGHRGARVRAAEQQRAWWWLTAMLMSATAAGILALDAAPASLRWTFLLPLVPAAWVAYAAIHGREKTTAGETAAAVAFAAAAVPICASAGSPGPGVAIALAFALLFVTATLAVRVIVLRTRRGSDSRAVRRTRAAAFALAGTGALLALAGASDGLVTWAAVAAILPGVLFVSSLAAFPPPAARLKKVGWSLVAVSAITALLLIAAV